MIASLSFGRELRDEIEDAVETSIAPSPINIQMTEATTGFVEEKMT